MKVKNSELKKENQLQKVDKKSKPKGDKSKKRDEKFKDLRKIVAKEPQLVTSEEKEKPLEKNNKKLKNAEKTQAVIKTDSTELDEKALKKIEKKKAKKLAKKLKKQQQKEEEKSNEGGAPEASSKQENKKANQTSSQSKKSKANKNIVLKERIERSPASEAATVFVGNLPVTTKRVQIAKLFLKYGGAKGIRLRTGAGQVIFKHVQRKKAGTLNAYVVLQDPETAKKALELNGFEFKGNHLRVTPSSSAQTHSDYDAKRTIFVGNLKHSANEEKLREIFSSCGDIDYIRCLGDGKNACKGVAYVCFKSAEAVGLALELNETLLDERPIHVERYSVKKLGAKEARDKQAAAVARINPKKGYAKKNNPKQPNKPGKDGAQENKKKSEFRGVKVTGTTKKKNDKKKTGNSEMRKLAKKIAPKLTKGKKLPEE